jgi:predicted tellurium resistance membrane protein TerC
MFDWIADPNAWLGLLTLTVLEIVLGIDNIVFISILSGKLKTPAEQERARMLGLGLALVSRVLLLLSIGWVTRLTFPVFELPFTGLEEEARQVSWRDLILMAGGAFLMYKAVKEIHDKLEGEETHGDAKVAPKLSAILIQILILDVVFSLDSVITAVGMVKDVGIMIAAVVIAVIFMMFFSGPIAKFVERHPSVKMLALSFLILIGVSLVAESFDKGIPKGYIYFAMAFSASQSPSKC